MVQNNNFHIGWMVHSIEDALAGFAFLGFTVIKTPIVDERRGVAIAFLSNGAVNIELIEPVSVESPISNLLRKCGPSPYHMCIETKERWESLREQAKLAGFSVIEEPANAPALSDRFVAFLYSRKIGIIEVLFDGDKE